MVNLKKCSFNQLNNDAEKRKLQIWLFGSGEKGISFLEKYKRAKVFQHIDGFIDNNESKQGKMVAFGDKEYPIISLEIFTKNANSQSAILITSSYAYDILNQISQIDELKDTPVYVDYLLEELYEPQKFEIEKGPKQCIPKKIHYCWFGNTEIPAKFQGYMDTWKRFCPDYEIIRWDESNYDVTKCNYMKEAYEAKKWAFVSDYARLDVINEYGGIYLDTDVELVKSLDDFLSFDFFCGFERNSYINFGLGFGSMANHQILENLLNTYRGMSFINDEGLNLTPCATYQLEEILNFGFEHQNEYQKIGNSVILPSEVFAPENSLLIKSIRTDFTHSIHHYSSTWWENDDNEELKGMKKRIIQCLNY